MNRPLLIALFGAVVVVAALILAFTVGTGRDEADPPPAVTEPLPAPPTEAPEPAAPEDEAAPVAEAPEPAPAPEAAPEAAEPVPEPAARAERQPSFDVVRVDRQGNTVMAGRAAPEAEIIISDGEQELGRVTADSRGEWVFLPDTPLSPGSRELHLGSRVGEDAVRQAEGKVVVVVPEPDADSDVPPLAVATAPNEPSRVLQAPAPALDDSEAAGDEAAPATPGEATVVIDVVDYDEAGNLSFGGRAAPGSVVLGYIDNRFVGRAAAGENGRWSVRVSEPVGAGRHTVRADAVGPQGREVLARSEIPFERPESVERPAGAQSVVVQPGNSLWRIAHSLLGEGAQYTVIYEANRAQIRNPDLIYPGQVFVIPGGEERVLERP